MSRKVVVMVLTVAVVAAGFLALVGGVTTSETTPSVASANQAATPAPSPSPQESPESSQAAYLSDFKSGYADGFTTGAGAFPYPDETALSGKSGGYLAGFEQGYSDGQLHQAMLSDRLCYSGTRPAAQPSYSGPRRASRVLGDRAYAPERSDRGLGSTARKALIIGSSAAMGAGVGGAIGGKKGAGVGALIGGGAGTALALTKTPSRAFNRRVTGKSVVTKTLIGAGTGAAVGALAGGKKGALAGAAIGGGTGVIWSLLDGRRVRR